MDQLLSLCAIVFGNKLFWCIWYRGLCYNMLCSGGHLGFIEWNKTKL